MGAREVRTAAEIEVLSPDERQRIFDEHVVDSIDELPAGFRARVRATGERLLRDRGLLDDQPAES